MSRARRKLDALSHARLRFRVPPRLFVRSEVRLTFAVWIPRA